MQREAVSTVQWAEGRPQFADELKFALPLHDVVDTALLFTFDHVAGATGSTNAREHVGFAALPLHRGTAVLADGAHHVAVHKTLADLAAAGFAQPLSAAEHKRTKHAFAFRTRVVSAVHAQDPHVARLLREAALPPAQSGPATRAVALDGLRSAPPAACARFLLPLLDALVHALATWAPAQSRAAFRALHTLLARVAALPAFRGREADSPVLAAWADTLLDPARLARAGVHLEEVFLHRWLEFITSSDDEDDALSDTTYSGDDGDGGVSSNTSSSTSDFDWFFLRIVAKAATVHAVALAEAEALSASLSLAPPPQGEEQQEQQQQEQQHHVQLSSGFQDDVAKLVQTLLSVYSAQVKDGGGSGGDARAVACQRANIEAVALFVNALYLFVDRGRLLADVLRFFAYTDADNRDALLCSAVKFPMLRRLADYEHYVPLNDPVPVDTHRLEGAEGSGTGTGASTTTDGVDALLLRQYPLAGAVQRQLCACLRSDHALVRTQAVRFLRSLLRKHSTDARYAAPAVRARVATMYVPAVCAVAQQPAGALDALDALGAAAQADLAQCVVWVLRHADAAPVAAWLRRDSTEQGRAAFFDVLARCVAALHGRAPALQDAIRTTCRVAERFVRAHRADLASARDPVFQSVYDALVLAFEECAPPSLGAVLAAVATLLRTLPEQFFAFAGNSFIDNISYNIMLAWSGFALGPALQHALVDLFYAMVVHNRAHSGDARRVRVQTTLAASRLVGEVAQLNTHRLLAFLDAVDARARAARGGATDGATDSGENADAAVALRQDVAEITTKVRTLLHYHLRIAGSRDADTTADLYYAAICAQDESPDLRATWLQNLATKQALLGNWEEAAQCNIFVALMVSQYLADVCHLQLGPRDFCALTPNGATRLTAVDVSGSRDTGQFQSDVWSLDSLVVLLQQAYTYLSNGAHYEQCIEVLSLLTTLWKRERNYARMMDTLLESTSVCQAIADTDKQRESRVFARYYRVAFYGARAGDLQGREFIYRRPPSCVLSVIQHEIHQHLLDTKVGGRADRVHLLPNRDIDPATTPLDPDAVYYQISSAEPYTHQGSSSSSSHSFDQHFGAHTFVFVQAHALDGQKAQTDSLRDQAKKKTIFETEIAFPFVKTRLEVVSKREVVLAPIENAIELIAERCERIRAQLQNNPPRLNPLQQVLQGSVAPMVNEGPLKICETFLSDAARQTERPEHVALLATAMCNFVELCAAALQLDQMLIGPKHRRFHEMLEAHYESLYTAVSRYLAGSSRVPKKTFTADDLDRKVWRDQPQVFLSK